MTAQSAEISVPYLEERLKSKPRSRAFSRLADAYRRRGDLRQAIDLCTEGLAQHPNYLTARLVLGRCYLAQKNYSAAAGELKKVCMADRRNHAALMMLAESYLQQGEEEKAGGIYQILLKMEPYNPWIEQLATRYKSLGDKDLFEILEISSPNLDSSLQNLKSSGVDDLTDIQNLDTIQSDPPPAQSTEGDEPTSQDVEERLDLLFEEKAAQPPESPTQAQNEFELSESPNTPEPSDSDVSGSDVSSRLDELFGDEKNEDSDPFSLNSAETIQMNRDDLIQNTSDVDLPAPESEIEAETSGDQLLDFDAGETIQMDRVQLGEAMEKEESPQPADSNQPESDLTEKTIAWDNDNDEIKAAEDSEEGYEDGIDTPEQINQEPSPSGEDIIETLDNLFGKETASDSEKGPETSAPEESESDQDKEVTASDIEKRLQELFPEDEEKKEVSSSQESGTINHSEIVEVEDFTKPEEEVMDQVEDINSELSDLPNTESKNITETEEKINDENVTGADVEKQLDQLFPEESNLGEASHEEPAFDDQTSDDENVSKADIEEKPDQTTPQENADKPESISQIEQDDVFETIELKDESPKEQTVGSDESVSGADIEEKLDQIFPKENADKAESSSQVEENDVFETIELKDESPKEQTDGSDESVSGADIEEKLDQIFPKETSVEKSSSHESDTENQKAVPEKEQTDTDENVTGQDVERKLDQLFPEKNAGNLKKKTPEGSSSENESVSGDDVQERIRELFTSEEASENKRVAGKQKYEESSYSEEEIDDRDEPFSLPDHVLTPTLADIYFQQGQPRLALQIYERLAQKDPDDGSISQKTKEIRDHIEHSEENELPQSVPEKKPSKKTVKKSSRTQSGSTSATRKKKRSEKDNRPLAGVRIKKKPKRRSR